MLLPLLLAASIPSAIAANKGEGSFDLVAVPDHYEVSFDASERCPEDFCSVEDFLAGLTIDIAPSLIPPQTAMGFNVNITKLHLSNIRVADGIESRQDGRHLELVVAGLGADIIGRVKYAGFLMKDTVNFTVNVAESSAKMQIEFIKRAPFRYPVGIEVHDCTMDLQLANLDLRGTSWSGSMLSSVKGLVKSAIKSAVRRWACAQIRRDLTELTALRELSKMVAPGEVDPPLSDSDLSNFLDWRQVAVIKWVSDVADKHLRLDGMQAILREIFPNMQEALYAESVKHTADIFGMAQEHLGNATIQLDRLSLSTGFGGLRELKLPNLEQQRDAASLRVSWTVRDSKVAGRVRIEVDPTIAGMGHRKLTAGFTFTMDMAGIMGYADVTALVNKPLDSTVAAHTRSISAWNPACLLPSVEKVYMADANVDFTISSLVLEPLYKSDTLAADTDKAINNFVALMLVEFPTLPKDAVRKALVDSARPMINDLIHDALYRARLLAPPSMCTDNAFKDTMSGIFLHSSCVLLGLAGMVFFISWMVLEPLLKTLSTPLGLTCLASDPAVAARFSLTMPLVIASVMMLFLSSSFSLGAAVVAVLECPGSEPVILPPIFEFTLDSTIQELWEAGVYVLMILVGLFSGLFPYVKLVLLFACWVLPTSKLSKKMRGDILRVVDVLGKWSLVDVYVMVMFMVSFEFTMPIRDAKFRVLVEPRYGFATFVMATIASMTCGHLLLGWHEHSAPDSSNEIGGSTKGIASVRVQMGMALHSRIKDAQPPKWRSRSVSEMLSRQPTNTTIGSASFSWFGKSLLPAVLLVCLFCVLVGSKLPLITFRYSGLTGRLLEATQGLGANVKTLSLLSIGLGLSSVVPDDAHRLGGIYWLQLMYFVLSAGVVLLYILVVIVCYFVPIYFPFRKRFLAFTRTVHAWMSLDVLVISVIAAVAQIDMFTQFMIGHKCDVINYFLENVFRNQVDEATCFRVEPRFEAGTVLLSMAVLLAVPAGSIVVHGLEKVTEELDADEEAEAALEEKPSELASSSFTERPLGWVVSERDSVEMSPFAAARLARGQSRSLVTENGLPSAAGIMTAEGAPGEDR